MSHPPPQKPPAPATKAMALPVPLYRARALARRALWRMGGLLRPPTPSLGPRRAFHPPLRVGFVVCDQGKWGLGTVLEHLRALPGIEVGLYPTLSDVHLRLPPEARRAAFHRERDFFADLAPIWADLYDPARDRMRGPEAIACDLVFIQQPWGMQDWPRLLARRCHVAYVHYGMAVISNDRMQFGLPHFHPWLWRYFVPTRAHAEAIRAAPGGTPRLCVTGHPKFDAYHSPPPERARVQAWPQADPDAPPRRRVIVAPHHGLERGSLGLGTFAWSGEVLWQMARRHRDVDFLLRPHPNMALGLERAGLMSQAQWHAYKRRWQDLPNGAVFEGGAYMEVLRSSDLMITDSGSFLAEYLPTGAPILRLEQAGSAPLNGFGQRLAPAFYRARSPQELQTRFAAWLAGNDPLAPARAEATRLLLPCETPAAALIAAQVHILLEQSSNLVTGSYASRTCGYQ